VKADRVETEKQMMMMMTDTPPCTIQQGYTLRDKIRIVMTYSQGAMATSARPSRVGVRPPASAYPRAPAAAPTQLQLQLQVQVRVQVRVQVAPPEASRRGPCGAS
jgi:hypothetical protein